MILKIYVILSETSILTKSDFCFVFRGLVYYVASFPGLSIFDCPFSIL